MTSSTTSNPQESLRSPTTPELDNAESNKLYSRILFETLPPTTSPYTAPGFDRRLFYKQPILDNISAGTGWDRMLFQYLHLKIPAPYNSYHEIAKAYNTLLDLFQETDGTLLSSLTRTSSRLSQLLVSMDRFLEQGFHLDSECNTLINDLLRAINDKDTVFFDGALRQRCDRMQQKVENEIGISGKPVYDDHERFEKRNILAALAHRSVQIGSSGAFFATSTATLMATIFTEGSRALKIAGAGTAFISGTIAHSSVTTAPILFSKVASAVKTLFMNTYILLWAWLDFAELLKMIYPGESISGMVHAKTFLQAFQAAFLGANTELVTVQRRMYGSYWHSREGLETRAQNAPHTGVNNAMTHHVTYPPPATSPVHRSSKLDSSRSSHKVSVQPAIVEGLAPGPTTRNESLSVSPRLSEIQHPSGQSSDNRLASSSGSKGKA